VLLEAFITISSKDLKSHMHGVNQACHVLDSGLEIMMMQKMN